MYTYNTVIFLYNFESGLYVLSKSEKFKISILNYVYN